MITRFADKNDPAQVTRYMASSQGQDFPRFELLDKLMNEFKVRLPEELRPTQKMKTLSEMVGAVGGKTLLADDPNEVHQVLASLNLPLYLTTNCDNFMTAALAARGRQPSREICRWNESWMSCRRYSRKNRLRANGGSAARLSPVRQ